MNTVLDPNGHVVIITSSVKTAHAVQTHGLQVVAPKKPTYTKKRYAQ